MLAIGGDGTANEIAWGLLGTSTVLGLVPMGSGNGLARTLGIPLKPDRALATLADAVPRAMDVGMINERPFLNVAGAGFDAQVGLDFHEHGRRGGRRGVFTYVWLSVLRTMSYRAESWVLDAGAQKFEGRAYIVAFVNGRQYGGGAVLVPGARLDDGLLDIVVIEDAPALELAWNAQRLFFGTLAQYQALSAYARGRQRRSRATGAPSPITATGSRRRRRDAWRHPSFRARCAYSCRAPPQTILTDRSGHSL